MIKKRMKYCIYFLNAFLIFGTCKAQVLTVNNIRCESKSNPVGIDVTAPALSWQLASRQSNVMQAAYHILVADDSLLLAKNMGNTWDSRKVLSSASIQVLYGGSQLQSTRKYYWKVKIWDNRGNVSAWSTIGTWRMGLLTIADWNGASWIAYEKIHDTAIIVPHAHGNGKRAWGPRRNVLPLLRKTFSVSKEVKHATAYLSGLGHFEFSVNGRKAGDHFLDPGWTDYKKKALYVAFDVTGQLRNGDNAMGIILGNGFYYIPGQRYRKMTGAYGQPKAIVRLFIEYRDGSHQDIISDDSWLTAPSPIIFSSIFGGEDYDAGREQMHWNEASFNASGWQNALKVDGPPSINAQLTEPVKVMETFEAKKYTRLRPGVVVVDLGQNFSGIPSVIVNGRKGDTVRIYPAELVNEDGSANQRATGSPAYFTYILKGRGDESWQPRFTYTGFRYLEIRSIRPGDTTSFPSLLSVKGLHIRNATGFTGSFVCSNDLFNRTYTLIDWAIKSNSVSLFTDCPHREKLGWLEQTYLMGSSVHFGYDIELLNRKMIDDMYHAQHADGKIPEIAPEYTAFTPPFDESPEWGSASIILPWYQYQWYGDIRTLSQAYEMMKRYADYLQSKATDNILTHGLGDWFDLGPNRPGLSQMTRMGVTGTATYYYDLGILSKAARLLNKEKDAREFEQRASAVKSSFNKRFFDPAKGHYDSASQAANAMALFVGLVDSSNKSSVLHALVGDIRARNASLTAGDIGFRYVLRALEAAGRSDVIFEMNNRDDVPGYGYQLRHGATALTESWQALPIVSNNHFMLGHLMEWFYSGLAGIVQKENSIAYRNLEIRPQPVGDIRFAKASYMTPYGIVESFWKKNGKKFELQVTIPPNSNAEIFLPGQIKGIRAGSGVHNYRTLIN